MKVGINLTDYYRGTVGGIRVYLVSLVKNLPIKSPKDSFYVICRPSRAIDFKFPKIKIITIDESIQDNNLSNKLLELIKEKKFNLWFSPLLRLDPLNCPIPSIFVIPDLQHETFPDFFEPHVLRWRRQVMAQSVMSADHIITISNFSKSDIVKHLKVDPSKISVTHLSTPYWHDTPYNKEIDKETVTKYSLKKNKYLLFPANAWPHKNFIRLLEAFNRIKNKHKDINLLLIVQGTNISPEIRQLINNYNLQERIQFTGFVEDRYMQYIFRNSLGVVFPSLFEGFGIPALEGMKNHVPVACSNTTSLPEICEKAVLYFNPLSIPQITKAIDQLIINKRLVRKLIKEGDRQIKKFNYQKTTNLTLKIFRQVVAQCNKETRIQKYPKISIITPSYNQGKYIERTIKSVLDQNYPNLEYIIMDGGSTDNTVEILKKYNSKIIWKSEKDRGQTHAINKGIAIATGEIISYLNSDDVYEPGCFDTIAKYFISHPRSQITYGFGKLIDQDDRYIKDYHNAPANFDTLYESCHISQPSVFWTRKLFKDIGYFDEDSDYAMDYEYWIRASQKYQFGYIKKYLSSTRIHPQTKTNSQSFKIHKNVFAIHKKYYQKVNNNWLLSYANLFLSKYDHRIWSHQLLYQIHLSILLTYFQIKYNHQSIPLSQINPIKQQLRFLIKNNPLQIKINNYFISASKKYQSKLLQIKNLFHKIRYRLSIESLFKKYQEIGILNQYPPKPVYIEKFPLKNVNNYLKISIITPSFNQGGFIERTIKSVIDQRYPNLEYIVQDGNSHDDTTKILKKYNKHLIFESKKDTGQTNALNIGFRKTTGEIMAYLNSDDELMPESLHFISQYFQEHPDVDVIYGNRIIINENSMQIGRWTLPPYNQNVLKFIDYVPQETLFWRRSVWNKVGGKLDESFRFAMDWDLIVRLIEANAKFKHVPFFLGKFRVHSQQKTSTQINTVGQRECDRILKRVHGVAIPQSDIIKLLDKYRKKSSIVSWLLDHQFKI